MILTILKEKLNEGLKLAEKITQKSLTLPILQTTLLVAEKNFLKLAFTNLETGINWWNLSKVEKEGKICIPLRPFSQLVNFLPQKPLLLSLQELNLNIECENYRTKLIGVPPEEFPIIPQPKNLEPFSIESSIFFENLSSLLKIPSPSAARPEISGIFFSFQENLIKMVATDSFRLAEKKIFLKNPVSQKISFILPQTSAREMVNIFGEEKGVLRIYFSPIQVWFEVPMYEIDFPKIQYTSRLIEGEYPNYEEVIPKKFGVTFQIAKEEFLNQIRIAGLFSGKSNEIRLKIDPKNEIIKVLSQSPNLGYYESSLKAKIKGKEMEIAFNWRFLADGLGEVKTPEIILNLTDHEGPTMIKPLEGEDYFYLVMPIKTS